MRKLMMLAAMLAVVMVAAAPALAQDPAVVADSTKAPTAKAGGAEAKVDCPDGIKEAKAGGVVAKAACPPPPPPPPPAPKVEVKAETPKAVAEVVPAPPPPPAPKVEVKAETPKAKAEVKELPKTGGSTASLFALGAGTLLVAGGLLARRMVK